MMSQSGLILGLKWRFWGQKERYWRGAHGGDDNTITVTARDAAGNSATDTLTIDVKPCPVGGFQKQ